MCNDFGITVKVQGKSVLMKTLISRVYEKLRSRQNRRLLTRFVSITAAVVVFITTYALVLPAITMEEEALCGIPAHQHDVCAAWRSPKTTNIQRTAMKRF